MSSSSEDLYLIADELHAIANLGRHFSKDEYDLDRYRKIRALSARIRSIIERRPPDDILQRLEDNVSHMSPLIGADAAVFKEDHLLLIKRHDDGLWAMPGGLVEVGETSAQGAERELWEETHIKGHATQLMGVFDSRIWETRSDIHMYHFVYLTQSENLSPSTTSEATDFGFFKRDDLPPLSQGHHLRVPLVLQLHHGEKPMPFFDPA